MICELCEAVKNNEGTDTKGLFIILICKIHNVPMLVLKEHKSRLTGPERQEAEWHLRLMCPGRRFRGYMQSIKGHWHDHMV